MRRAAALSFCLLAVVAAVQVHAECRMQPGPRRAVTRAVDGETLQLDDGSEVRLAGIVAPRGSDAAIEDAAWPPAVDALRALAALAEGQTVVIGSTGAARSDRLGRHVGQAFVVAPGKETWLQGEMLAGGHARASQQRDQRGCAEELLAFEAGARQAGRGLWANAAYAPRPAARPRDLETMAGHFVILSGRVAWVAPGRQTVAFGFSERRGGTFGRARGVTVLIDNADRELLGALGGDPKALEGHEVEVRGWLERRLGRPAGSLVIDVSMAGMLILPRPPEAAAGTGP